MAVVTMKQLLEAGVHFGHQTRRWNPKMKKYIFAARNGIYILDLQKTVKMTETVVDRFKELVRDGGHVLFVGTKKQAQESVQVHAERCGMYYVHNRWLGGLLTNYETISKRIAKLKDLEQKKEIGYFDLLPKKEAKVLNDQLNRLNKYLGGIKNMPGLPAALFVVDLRKERIAVAEARKLGIPVAAIVDTNCDPDEVDYPIPGNDDAIRAIKLFCTIIADAAIKAREELYELQQASVEGEEAEEQIKAEAGAETQAAEAAPGEQAAEAAAPVKAEPGAEIRPAPPVGQSFDPEAAQKQPPNMTEEESR